MITCPPFLATGIGSMPFTDPERAVTLALRTMPEAPFWPQLPKLGLREEMIPQYTEGLPGVVFDDAQKRFYFDTAGDYGPALVAFYEAYLAAMDPATGTGDCACVAMSPAFAHGLHALQARLQREPTRRPFIKVQTTGPCTFTLGAVDQNRRALYYHEEFREVIVKALAMKCRWQIRLFQPYADTIICFIDEPILSAFGSSTYVGVQRADVVALIAEMVAAIHAEGALAGVHCCGNTEWSILIDAGVDIVNFDAFEYGETIALYRDAVGAHLERGGSLAWGVVPTSAAIREQTVDSLVARCEAMMDFLAGKGIAKRRIVEQAMITPSCGTGAMTPEDAERVFALTPELVRALRTRY
ncbi:MAG: hypothetical protein HYV36_08605 [Lentisphaerae bacterium]|nr:hypothetical protein [Lentisphaerota bacterium]